MNLEEIKKINSQSLPTDKELERVEIFVLHYAIPENTVKCLSSLLSHSDHPYKITVLDTSVYQRGVIARIYNKLIRESTCDYVAFMCSDAEFHNPWLKKFMRHLKENKRIGCVVPLVNPAVNPRMDVKPNSGEYELSENAISISVSLFRRQDILDAGGFDERFYLYGHDVDMLTRLAKKYTFILDSSVVADHGVGSTTKMVFTKKEIEEIDYYNSQIK